MKYSMTRIIALLVATMLLGCMESDIDQIKKSFLSGHYENEIGESFDKAFGPMTWEVLSEGSEKATIIAKGKLTESMGKMIGDMYKKSAESAALGAGRDPAYAWKLLVSQMRLAIVMNGLLSSSTGTDATSNSSMLQKKFLNAFKDDSINSFHKLGRHLMSPGVPVIASFTWDKKFGKASLDTLIIKNEYGGMNASDAKFYIYDYNIYGSRDFGERAIMEH